MSIEIAISENTLLIKDGDKVYPFMKCSGLEDIMYILSRLSLYNYTPLESTLNCHGELDFLTLEEAQALGIISCH